MSKCFSIICHECKMQLKRIAIWVVLFAASAIALTDNLPTVGNLARLEFLVQPTYFIYRTMSLDALIMIFGLMFLLSSSFPLDRKTEVKSLIMASPVTKWQYILGKLLGGFLYTVVMLILFLVLNAIAYLIVAPFDVSVTDCLVPLIKTLVVSVLPVSVFISFTSVALPAAMDMRLFYLLASSLFFVNASSVGSAGQMPFYMITSGDLTKFIWQHPKWPFVNAGSVQANLIFLVGCGLTSGILLFLKRKFWRAD